MNNCERFRCRFAHHFHKQTTLFGLPFPESLSRRAVPSLATPELTPEICAPRGGHQSHLKHLARLRQAVRCGNVGECLRFVWRLRALCGKVLGHTCLMCMRVWLWGAGGWWACSLLWQSDALKRRGARRQPGHEQLQQRYLVCGRGGDLHFACTGWLLGAAGRVPYLSGGLSFIWLSAEA